MEVTHRTAQGISSLQNVVSRSRFLELTKSTPVEDLREEDAFKVYQHLVDMQDYYHDFINLVIDKLETNQVEPITNPRMVATMIVPSLVDRLSRDTWNGADTPPHI